MGLCSVEETARVQGYEAAESRLGTSGDRAKGRGRSGW